MKNLLILCALSALCGCASKTPTERATDYIEDKVEYVSDVIEERSIYDKVFKRD